MSVLKEKINIIKINKIEIENKNKNKDMINILNVNFHKF